MCREPAAVVFPSPCRVFQDLVGLTEQDKLLLGYRQAPSVEIRCGQALAPPEDPSVYIGPESVFLGVACVVDATGVACVVVHPNGPK